MSEPVKAPFPYFGGKSRAAGLVWERFGKVVNYVEPFAGSLAVLLACPEDQRARVETVNDANAFLANFWRATAWDPEAVARWADWPVNETDLHSRHKWLLRMAGLLRARLDRDPTYYDARIAGWWVWGASAWIGSGWCEEGKEAREQLPAIGGKDAGGSNAHPGRGIHAAGMREPSRQLPDLIGAVGNPGKASGVHNKGMRAPSRRLPDLAGGTQWGTDEPNARAGRGVHSGAARGPSVQLPRLDGNGGTEARGDGKPGGGAGVHAFGNRTRLYDIFAALSARLRHVRVACGDFERILTDAVTHRHGLTAVFLDPPYEGFEGVYGAAHEGQSVAARAREWALKAGERTDMRVCLAGYEGEHDMPASWECVAWKAKGGYSNAAEGGNNGNARRERLWFSPACLRPGITAGQMDLFAGRTP